MSNYIDEELEKLQSIGEFTPKQLEYIGTYMAAAVIESHYKQTILNDSVDWVNRIFQQVVLQS